MASQERKCTVCLNSENLAKEDIIAIFIIQILEEMILHNSRNLLAAKVDVK